MTQQLSMFSARSGVETFRPISAGDVLVTGPFGRVIVTAVDDNAQGPVFICASVVDGRTCIVLPREVTYRSC